MNATLEISNLSKSFDEITAVDNLSFTAYPGEIIALLGPNGAGKSTLMNMIAGYLAPTTGDIKVLGRNIRQNALFAKENIGFLPEGAPLYPDLSVAAFLNYMAELRGISKNKIPALAQTAKITNVMHQKIETLSKGYLRRVGFAQSILSDPPLLLLDEPTDGLDPNQKDHIRGLITQMGKDKTILISTHLLDEAAAISTRIILMNKGRIMADGSLKNILKTGGMPDLETAFRRLTR